MKNSGPITQNGIHPISKTRVIPKGTAGAKREDSPKPSQAAAAGAKSTTAPHMQPKDGKPVAPAQGAEVKSGGSTAEEQKGLGTKFYPKVLGLRGRSSV